MSVFTTLERPALEGVIMVQGKDGGLRPFSRDRLFICIYKSCEHRPHPAEDAGPLTQTIVSKLISGESEAVITSRQIANVAARTLKRFDPAAASIYSAYHPKT